MDFVLKMVVGQKLFWLDDPGCVPCYPPAPEVALQLCECFQCEVRALERRLHQAKLSSRRQAHLHNPNLIFKDTKRPPPEPVTSLLVQSSSVVVEVDETDVAVVIEPPCQFDDSRPVVLDTVPVQVIHATDTKLYLTSVQDAMVGTNVTQSSPVGALDAVFEAFHEQWKRVGAAMMRCPLLTGKLWLTLLEPPCHNGSCHRLRSARSSFWQRSHIRNPLPPRVWMECHAVTCSCRPKPAVQFLQPLCKSIS